MYIKKPHLKKKSSRFHQKSHTCKIVFISGIVCGLAFALLSKGISFGIELNRTDPNMTYKKWITREFIDKISVVPNFVNGFFTTPQRLIIDIKYKDYQKIAYKRKEALQRGILETSSDDYVPAKITLDGKQVRAKIRLKGDAVDFLRVEKWPFRIVVKGGETLMGMKVFSIHDPKARNDMYEWFFHWLMRREGIIAPRYHFVDVTINGKDLGLFGLEENFEKRILENSGRREGPIIFFNEDVYMKSVSTFGIESIRAEFYTAAIDVHRPSSVLEDPVQKKYFLYAKDLLESFRQGEKKACDVFDCQIMGRYLALLDFLNARHAGRYGNMRFYFNPLTAKIEPVAYDAEYVGKSVFYEPFYAESWHLYKNDIFSELFKDLRLFEIYMQQFNRMSKKKYLYNAMRDVKNELNDVMKVVHTYNPFLRFDTRYFEDTQKFMTDFLEFPLMVHANFVKHEKKGGEEFIELNVMNLKTVPIRILAAYFGKRKLELADETNILKASEKEDVPYNRKFHFRLPDGIKWEDHMRERLFVRSRILGVDKDNFQPVIPWDYYDAKRFESTFFEPGNDFLKRDFLSVDHDQRTVVFKQGEVLLKADLIIPPGFKVYAFEGTHIKTGNNAKIISYSPIVFRGKKNNEIIIESVDAAGQGILVIDRKSEETSVVEHVIFKNLMAPQKGLWQITGAVSFYNTTVEISNSQFLSARAEDALNIVQSTFEIKNSSFDGSASDSFDADFSDGSVIGARFKNSGNDALDFSGSVITIENVFIDKAGDKGVSVGEQSRVTIKGIVIKNSNVAIASKDLAHVDVTGLNVEKCEYGLVVYQKKSEFGPGFMNTWKVHFNQTPKQYLVEKEATLFIEGKKINQFTDDVLMRITP